MGKTNFAPKRLGCRTSLRCRAAGHGHNRELLDEYFVHVAPDPIFAGLDGLHQGVMGSVKMLGGVLVPGGIATAHVSAFETGAQVHPGVAHL